MPFSKLKGRRLMLVNMLYHRPSKITDWKDSLTVIYKDLITGKKDKMIIPEPTVTIYIVKDEYRTFRKPRQFMTMDRLEPKEVKYRNVLYEIAKIAGPEYVSYYKEHTKKEQRHLYKYPYVLGGDIDVVTYYMALWAEQVGNTERKVPTKLYLDIEIDQIDYEGSIARHGECEINAVSVVDDIKNTVYTFLLDNGKNPLIDPFIKGIESTKKKMHEMFDDSYGKLDYNVYMFTDEREMLTQLFSLIHTLNRDMCLIWNMAFDIPYIMARLEVLGLDPKDIMCGKGFPLNNAYYYEDHRTFEFANKKDYFTLSDNTVYIDQLIVYAALRKSQGTVKKVNLGSVAQKVLKDSKLDYGDVGNIRTLPYEDFERFYIYNVKDTLLQMGIERKNKDMDNLYLISSGNNIAYNDALKQTVTFRGFAYAFMKQIGIVLGHNVNFDQGSSKYDEYGDKIETDEDEEGFEGAINGDPILNNNNGILVFGVNSKFLYALVIDFDFSSMYPNAIVAFNIFATTMIGKVIIDHTNVELDDPYDDDYGKEYVEDLIQDDVCFIGHKWHKLSDYATLSNKIKERFGGF